MAVAIQLPGKNGEEGVYALSNGCELHIRRVDVGVYHASIPCKVLRFAPGPSGTRWGNAAEIREDARHAFTYGTLPRGKSIWS